MSLPIFLVQLAALVVLGLGFPAPDAFFPEWPRVVTWMLIAGVALSLVLRTRERQTITPAQ